jgi:hypothetical protein
MVYEFAHEHVHPDTGTRIPLTGVNFRSLFTAFSEEGAGTATSNP